MSNYKNRWGWDGSDIWGILRYPDPEQDLYPVDLCFYYLYLDSRFSDILLKTVISGGYPDPSGKIKIILI